MWPKDVPPPRYPHRRRRNPFDWRTPVSSHPGYLVLWIVARFEERATCCAYRHGSTIAVRLTIDGTVMWQSYLIEAEVASRTEFLLESMTRDGWVVVPDHTVRVRA